MFPFINQLSCGPQVVIYYFFCRYTRKAFGQRSFNLLVSICVAEANLLKWQSFHKYWPLFKLFNSTWNDTNKCETTTSWAPKCESFWKWNLVWFYDLFIIEWWCVTYSSSVAAPQKIYIATYWLIEVIKFDEFDGSHILRDMQTKDLWFSYILIKINKIELVILLENFIYFRSFWHITRKQPIT